MVQEIELSRADSYFVAAIQVAFSKGVSSFSQADELFEDFIETFLTEQERYGHIRSVCMKCFFQNILRLEKHGACEVIRDEFASPFVKFNKKSLGDFLVSELTSEIRSKHKALGASGDSWLGSALYNISRKVDIAELDAYFDNHSDEQGDDIEDAIGHGQDDPTDQWTPLKIDREAPEFTEAVASAERALREIEASNGYAATEEKERNAIVATIRGSLEALKTGTPSLNSLISGLLRPMQFIAKKFAETVVGETAKIAVTHIVRWLFG